jgi:hypothetical protein
MKLVGKIDWNRYNGDFEVFLFNMLFALIGFGKLTSLKFLIYIYCAAVIAITIFTVIIELVTFFKEGRLLTSDTYKVKKRPTLFSTKLAVLINLITIFNVLGCVWLYDMPLGLKTIYILRIVCTMFMTSCIHIILWHMDDYVSEKDFFLENIIEDKYHDAIVAEYKELKDNLLLETSIKENRKLFRQLANEYYKIYGDTI